MLARGLTGPAVAEVLADLRRNPKAPQYGRCGGLFVRWGKASKGSPPRRRTVLTVPEMDWITGVLEHWISEVRPVFGPGPLGALWVTERASRISVRAIDDAFTGQQGGWAARRAGPALAPTGLSSSSPLRGTDHVQPVEGGFLADLRLSAP